MLEPTLDSVYRVQAGRLLALLVGELRDFDLAEDALQEAWEAAARQWPRDGLPANPGGWLLTVARRRARDRLRRAGTLARKLPLLMVEEQRGGSPAATTTTPAHDGSTPPPGASDERATRLAEEDDVIPDERLRLVFTSCHPALAPEVRLALTLRFVAGLSTREVARLLLVSEPTMAARLTRAKQKIAQSGIPYRVPRDSELPERLESVLAVVYLVFTEGYLPASGPQVVRAEVCAEAIRLGRLLRELLPDEAEPVALLALMTLQHARRDARVDADGRIARLEDQARERWRSDEIAEGLALVEEAARRAWHGAVARPYVLEALIAAEHARAATAAATDWHVIAELYARLEQVKPSPIVRLARAVAVAEADGPAAALPLLDGVEDRLPRNPQPHVARAELLRALDRPAEARAAYDRALALAQNDAVRDHLAARRDGLVAAPPPTAS
ncbi:MAG TPA: sigma-70 family RNA polymerase sigma factor [Conexibacter sp.]